MVRVATLGVATIRYRSGEAGLGVATRRGGLVTKCEGDIGSGDTGDTGSGDTGAGDTGLGDTGAGAGDTGAGAGVTGAGGGRSLGLCSRVHLSSSSCGRGTFLLLAGGGLTRRLEEKSNTLVCLLGATCPAPARSL